MIILGQNPGLLKLFMKNLDFFFSNVLLVVTQCCGAKICLIRLQLRLHFSPYFASGCSSSPILPEPMKNCSAPQHCRYGTIKLIWSLCSRLMSMVVLDQYRYQYFSALGSTYMEPNQCNKKFFYPQNIAISRNR